MPRRPLCYAVLAHGLGIACEYIFSPPGWSYALLIGLLSAFFLPCVLRKKPGVFCIVCAIAFFIGALHCHVELGKIDPLSVYAVSHYHNTAIGRDAAADEAVHPDGMTSDNNAKVLDVDAKNLENDAEHPDNGAKRSDSHEKVSDTGAKRSDNIEEIPENKRIPAQSGRVLSVETLAADYHRMTVRSGGRNLLLRVSGEGIEPKEIIGRRIRFQGKAELPVGQRNPGGFDYRLYLMSRGIRVTISCDTGDIGNLHEGRDLGGDFYNAVNRLKYNFLGSAKQHMRSESYALFAGMVFGDKQAMDETLYEAFQRNGVAHILSVSGLHVAIVYAFIGAIFGKRRTILASLMAIGFLVMYALLSEFAPSVVRAVVMISVHIAARLLHQRYDLLTGICFAAFLMLVCSPLQLFNAGFQLSFLAVALLAFALPAAERFVGYRDSRTEMRLGIGQLESRGKTRWQNRLAIRMGGGLIPLSAIQIGMAPATAYMFNYVSISGIALNVPIVALAGIVLPIGMIMIPLAALASSGWAVSGFAAAGMEACAKSVDQLLDLIARLTVWADGLPFGHLQVVSPRMQFLMVFYAGLFFCLSERFRVLLARKQLRRAAIPAFAVLLAVLVSFYSPLCSRDDSALAFLDVGQGDCLLVRTPDGRHYLIDGGGRADYDVGRKILLPYLLKNGISRLDGVFATHLHADHFKGLAELSRFIPVDRLFLFEGSLQDLPGAPGVIQSAESAVPAAMHWTGKRAFQDTEIIGLAAGDVVTLGRQVYLEVLFPMPLEEEIEGRSADAGRETDENKNSLIMRLDYLGVTALITGDLGFEGEAVLLARKVGLKADILKVGHHGSGGSSSEAFLSAVDPAVSVIQVGRNLYGHPTAAVLEKLCERDIIIYRNDLDGAVLFDLEKDKIVEISRCERFSSD